MTLRLSRHLVVIFFFINFAEIESVILRLFLLLLSFFFLLRKLIGQELASDFYIVKMFHLRQATQLKQTSLGYIVDLTIWWA